MSTLYREYIIVRSRLSLNDVRSNGGIFLHARSIYAKNYTFIELYILRNCVQTSITIRDSYVILKNRADTHMGICIRWFLIGIPLNDFVYSNWQSGLYLHIVYAVIIVDIEIIRII